jgi:uncharacterized protein YcgI (DUF1989 family)
VSATSYTFGSETIVPARQGRAIRLRQGQLFAVVDVEGGQVGDLFAFTTDEAEEYLSARHTRMTTGRLFPLPGQAFASNQRRPLVTVIDDPHDGGHDMLCAACDSERYRQLGVEGHENCADNCRQAADAEGISVRDVPQPVNIFMRVKVENQALELLPATSQPGDRLVLRAEAPLVIVLSACPQDLSPVNNWTPTSLALQY